MYPPGRVLAPPLDIGQSRFRFDNVPISIGTGVLGVLVDSEPMSKSRLHRRAHPFLRTPASNSLLDHRAAAGRVRKSHACAIGARTLSLD
jgi:hypothetical protein